MLNRRRSGEVAILLAAGMFVTGGAVAAASADVVGGKPSSAGPAEIMLGVPGQSVTVARGLTIEANASSDITKLPPPIASPFIWSATKAPDGSVSFAGFVPDQDVRLTLTDAVGKIGADTTAVASGEPDGFATK